MSVYEQLFTLDPKLKKILAEKDASLRKQLQEISDPIKKFIETGDISILKKEFEKENIEPCVVTTQKKTRLRKPTILEEISENTLQSEYVKVKQEKLSIASSESTSSVASGTFLKVKESGRRTRQTKQSVNSETPVVFEDVEVKKEKISTIFPSDSDVFTIEDTIKDVDIEIKKEDMPAPRKLPPRKKKNKPEAEEVLKRSTRASEKRKESDVIMQNTTITKIDLTDSESESLSDKKSQAKSATPVQQSMRATRSKMRQKKTEPEPQSDNEKVGTSEPEVKKIRSTRTKPLKQNKRHRSTDEESVASQNEQKKSRSSASSENDDNKSAQTVYEDAVSSVETEPQNKAEPQNTADTTYVANLEPRPAPLDQTVVIEKPKMLQSGENDAEVKEKREKTPPKPKSKKQTKEMFSPYDKTPLKKKVEAFEKLEAAAAMQQSANGKLRSDLAPSAPRPKSKMNTPFSSKFLPKTCSTNKVSKLHPGSKLDTSLTADSTLSFKSLSALKASQAEFREREKRRQEREREALKKREALLEEKKKKREEKQLKAQIQRELLEKDKLKQIDEEQQRKDEKSRQAIAEKEKQLQKQKEEAEKKRLIAKKKAQLIKQQEEREARLAAEREAKLEAERCAKLAAEEKETNIFRSQRTEKMALPIYMIKRPPLLPTDDCYDSDSSEYKADYEIPVWSRDRTLERKVMLQHIVQEKLKNTFFCRQTHTPDLQEIFETIDPRKLKRTSSAVWKKPPRYTLFSVTSSVQFSDDEDISV